jgi:hypothetical protein
MAGRGAEPGPTVATLTRAQVRQQRRIELARTRLGQATSTRERCWVVADFLYGACADPALATEAERCAELDRLAAPVLALIRDPEEGTHDHSR